MMQTTKHNERCKECKVRVKQLLKEAFGKVEVNYDVALPSLLNDYSGTNIYPNIEEIYLALQKYRGFDLFVKTKKLPRVDFYIPEQKIIVEFDESQHFTQPRKISLTHYPKENEYGFSVEKWKLLCQKINKRDNDPPYRDEQRAWYDTLRDFAPILWGTGTTIRLYSSDFVWCSLERNNESDVTLFNKIVWNKLGEKINDKKP